MGLFDIFRNKESLNGNGVLEAEKKEQLPGIPENIFIQKDLPTENEKEKEKKEKGIYEVYKVLERNYEQKGYDDALMNPDSSNLHNNIQEIKSELARILEKQKVFYKDLIKEIQFHIKTREGRGMIELVEELKVKFDTATLHLNEIEKIKSEMDKGEGLAQSIILSYTKGFNNGLAAITYHNIISKFDI